MIRFRSIATVLVALSLAVSAYSQGTTGGLLYASDFANWSLPQGNTPMQGTVFYPNPDICKVTSNGYTFLAAKVGRPLTVVDGANTETFTVTAVSITTGACMISGSMAHSHSTYSIKSGTAGAQEAIDYQASQPQGANIVLTPAWTQAGGSTGVVTGTLKGNAGVTILDQRTSQLTAYTWSGSAYLPNPFAVLAAGTAQGNCAQIGTGNTISDTGAPCSSGTASIANQANGVIPLSTGSAAILAQSHIDDGVTTAATITASEPVTASVNKVISITAPPYTAKCDGATDDQTAIQAAFAAALSGGQSVQFPAGTCLTSPIVWKGQPFFGAGMGQTFIKGKPGLDVFHTTDGNATDFVQNPIVRDLTIQVDASVDASATAAGGNNSYPNRTFLVSTGVTPISPAIGASPFTWGDNFGCNDALNDGINSLNLTTLYLNCGAFTSVPPSLVVGQPLHINGAGPSIAGGAYSVTNGILTMTLTNAYSAGNQVTFLNFSGGLAGVKNWTFPVLAAGLSGSQFEVNVGTLLNDGSGTDASGTISLPVDATILTVVDAFHVTFTPAGVTNLPFGPNQGIYGPAVGNAPPGYCGAAGFAFPTTDGNNYNHNTNGITFRNVYITAVNTSVPAFGHTCGIYTQQQLAGLNVDHLFTRQMWGGYVESLPYNNSATIEYTPDESHGAYQNHSGDFFPLVLVNGALRNYGEIVIHDLNTPFAYGALFTVEPSNLSPSIQASIGQIYFDCYGHNLGETSRYMGLVNIQGGRLNNCGGGYTEWLASDSVSGVPVNASLHIDGSRNQFVNATFSGNSTVTDSGYSNSVITNLFSTAANYKRPIYTNRVPPQDPVGKLDGSFLVSGSSAAPFLNASDLMITCRDHQQWTGDSASQVCTNDPTGTEVTKSYLAVTGASLAGFGMGFVAAKNQNAGMYFGSRIPTGKLNVITQGSCDAASPPCTGTITFRDLTTLTNITTCSLSWGNALTINGVLGSATACQVDFSAVPAGDVFTWNINTFTGSPTLIKWTFMGMQPVNVETQTTIASTFAVPPTLGSTTPAPVKATTFVGSGNASVTGASTISTASGGQVFIGDANSSRLDQSGSGSGRIFSSTTQTVQGNTSVVITAAAGSTTFDSTGVNFPNGRILKINGSQIGSIVNGTSVMGTGAISAGTCATVVTTAATGAATTDAISWAFNAAPGTGYTAGLHVLAYPTSGNVNFLVCNPTAGSLTPAAATLNWRIVR